MNISIQHYRLHWLRLERDNRIRRAAPIPEWLENEISELERDITFINNDRNISKEDQTIMRSDARINALWWAFTLGASAAFCVYLYHVFNS